MRLNQLYPIADEGAKFVCAVKAAYDIGWRAMRPGESEARYLATNITGRMVACAGVGYCIAEDFGCMIGILAGATWFGAEWVAGVYLHEHQYPPVHELLKLETLSRKREIIINDKMLIELVEHTDYVEWE